MNWFIKLLRKEYRFSFIRVKSDKPFGGPYIDFIRSELKRVDDKIGISTTILILVSSAKSLVKELIRSTITLLYISKKRGPSI